MAPANSTKHKNQKTMTFKQTFAGLFLLLGAYSLQPAQAQAPSGDGYHLVWSDEFDYDGAPNSSKWSFEEGFVRNKEWQWYQPQNAVCRDGVMVITAKRELKPNPTYNPASNQWGEQRQNIECTSACATTKGKRQFLYGRFEVRARIPATRGSWPAIWFLGENGLKWPQNGEIDLMEFYPSKGTRSILANFCWGGKKGGSQWNAKAVPFTHWTERDSLWATQFHTWRMDWEEDFVRLYLDNELLNEMDLSKTVNAKGGKGEGVNPFHTPMYLLLNLAMGSSGGPVDEATLPVRYEIDYVRVYQKRPQ